MPRLRKQALDGMMQTLLLSVLAEGPSYGYEIVQELNRRGQGLLVLGEGTVYPLLHRLEERGLLAATWRRGELGRKRKYYRLTPKGRRALAVDRDQWASLVQVMNRVIGPEPKPAVDQ